MHVPLLAEKKAIQPPEFATRQGATALLEDQHPAESDGMSYGDVASVQVYLIDVACSRK